MVIDGTHGVCYAENIGKSTLFINGSTECKEQNHFRDMLT